MIRTRLVTSIAVPIDRCFDLARSIDRHMASTNWTGERAIAGVTSGLIGADQEVTWQGRHFGFVLTHTSQITSFRWPTYFQDCMVRGRFRRFCHDHYFETHNGTTLMRDEMEFEAPFGILGRLVEAVLLARHMRACSCAGTITSRRQPKATNGSGICRRRESLTLSS
jgi:ligand-binding SRPBCC domain-containing protein